MTTPLEPLDMPLEVARYYINESGLKINSATGELILEDNDTKDCEE